MIFKAEDQCPKCKIKGKKISIEYMINHINDISTLRNDFEYHICKNPKCEVVYFNIKNEYTTKELNKEVGYKNSSSSNANICYCYNIKKSELNEDVINTIKVKMKKSPCICEIRNPYSSCCMIEIKKLKR